MRDWGLRVKFGRMLARRNIHERQVIACLRGRDAVDLWNIHDARAFTDLSTIAKCQGVAIFSVESPFVSEGEILLLTQIATTQRLHGRALIQADTSLCNALFRCAVALKDAGIWLPRATLAEVASVSSSNPENLPMQFGRHGMARARALSLVRSREAASTEEFLSIGISRQYVSRLCKDGYLQRVRHGWYRAAPSASGRLN